VTQRGRWAAIRPVASRERCVLHTWLGADCRANHVAGRCCTTKLKNAHGTEFRELLYRFHPWSGFPIAIHEAINKPDGVVFRCDLVDSDSDRWLEIPAWMFDRSACAKVRLVATDPHADISALVALASLLRDVLRDPAVVSSIPDSIVSSLSGDPNQGDVHAISKQAGAPSSHTASSRFVRRKTTEASLVRAADGDTGSAHRPDYATNPGSRRQSSGRRRR
jgi:hypothetical protein